jgi:hypothetical protein
VDFLSSKNGIRLQLTRLAWTVQQPIQALQFLENGHVPSSGRSWRSNGILVKQPHIIDQTRLADQMNLLHKI